MEQGSARKIEDKEATYNSILERTDWADLDQRDCETA
jgi:hypothetical protein